jgi:hypothetical protein
MASSEEMMVNAAMETIQQPSENYDNLPLRAVYDAQGEDKSEFNTFKNFLQFKKYLDYTDKLEQQGVITVNRPKVEEEKEESSQAKWFWGTILFIMALGTLI